MRVLLSVKPLLKWTPPLALTTGLLLFSLAIFPALEGVGQTTGERVRFQTSQVIEQAVIDLEDETPAEVPRYNTIALGNVDAGSDGRSGSGRF